jgi:hypothetical protein
VADYAFLHPLFEATRPFAGKDAIRMMPRPSPGSSLAAEDAMLNGWWPTLHMSNALTSGVAHVEAFRRSVVDLKLVDACVPWTLLRAAQENFSLAVWLLYGETRKERLARALRVWVHDMHERSQHEKDTGHVPTGSSKTGLQRVAQMIDLADSLGIPKRDVDRRLPTSMLVAEAGDIVRPGHGAAARGYWRVASGFAHGRAWPNLRVGELNGAEQIAGGYNLAFVMNDAHLAELASWCVDLLGAAVTRYEARSKTP